MIKAGLMGLGIIRSSSALMLLCFSLCRVLVVGVGGAHRDRGS